METKRISILRNLTPLYKDNDQGCYPHYDADVFNTLMKFQEA